MTIQSWLWLAVCKLCKTQEIHIFKLNKIYLHQGIILHPATVYLCNFKELYLFNFKEMIYLLTVKEILILSNNMYLFTKSVIIWGNYILTRNRPGRESNWGPQDWEAEILTTALLKIFDIEFPYKSSHFQLFRLLAKESSETDLI